MIFFLSQELSPFKPQIPWPRAGLACTLLRSWEASGRASQACWMGPREWRMRLTPSDKPASCAPGAGQAEAQGHSCWRGSWPDGPHN